MNKYWGDPPKDIDNPTWEPLMVKPKGIEVIYSEKYGPTLKVNCIGIWYDKFRQIYRLTWKDSTAKELPACNLTSIEWKEIV